MEVTIWQQQEAAMPQDRKGTAPQQGRFAMGQGHIEDAPVDEPAPISAAAAGKPKAAKATATATAPTRVDKAGNALRCSVKMGASQCSNPGRWEHKPGWTCTTHHKAILAGRKVDVRGRLTLPVQPLWSKPKAATESVPA